MNRIYTNKGSLIVERTIWSGVQRYVKHADGKCEHFYRTNTESKFTKRGWGKRAERDFDVAFQSVKSEINKGVTQ